MSRTRNLTWLAVAAVALCCATCAPIGPPSTDKDNPQGETQAPFRLQPPEGPGGLLAAQPDALKQRLELAIDNVQKRDLLTTHGFWTVFHGILGLGMDVELLDPETGKRVNAVDYICKGNKVRGLEFIQTEHGLDVLTSMQPGGIPFVSQGHQDQFAAEMAQHGMALDRKFTVLGKDYTFMDFVRHSKMRARVTQKQELGWTILLVGQYLGTDIAWANSAGEKLHFEDMVRYELDQPMDKAACGGTHRLFGLSWVYHLHIRKGGKKTGVWQDVAAATAKYQQLAHTLQNPDGSFSTEFFRERGNAQDMQRRINTSGHILEWLAFSLPDSELRKPWMQEAANAVATMVLTIQGQPMEGGTLYHAVHGLILYRDRVYDRDKLSRDTWLPLPPEENVVQAKDANR